MSSADLVGIFSLGIQYPLREGIRCWTQLLHGQDSISRRDQDLLAGMMQSVHDHQVTVILS